VCHRQFHTATWLSVFGGDSVCVFCQKLGLEVITDLAKNGASITNDAVNDWVMRQNANVGSLRARSSKKCEKKRNCSPPTNAFLLGLWES